MQSENILLHATSFLKCLDNYSAEFMKTDHRATCTWFYQRREIVRQDFSNKIHRTNHRIQQHDNYNHTSGCESDVLSTQTPLFLHPFAFVQTCDVIHSSIHLSFLFVILWAMTCGSNQERYCLDSANHESVQVSTWHCTTFEENISGRAKTVIICFHLQSCQKFDHQNALGPTYFCSRT